MPDDPMLDDPMPGPLHDPIDHPSHDPLDDPSHDPLRDPMQDAPHDPLLNRLLELAQELTEGSEGYLDRQDDPQLWYNRGYANGMLAALRALGHGDRVDATFSPDCYDPARDQAHLPWGKAYEHGREMGVKETYEVYGLSPPQ
jgi:hypothetical protein